MQMGNEQLWVVIEEYKTLRGECLKVFEQRTIPLVYMSAIIVTLITGAVQFKEDFIFSLVLTSIFPVAVHWIGKRCTVARISYYIKTQIEPKIKGLNWENWIWEQRGNKLDDMEERIVSDGVMWFYILVGLACASYYVCKHFTPFSVALLIYNILLAIILLVLLWISSGRKQVWKVQGSTEAKQKP